MSENKKQVNGFVYTGMLNSVEPMGSWKTDSGDVMPARLILNINQAEKVSKSINGAVFESDVMRPFDLVIETTDAELKQQFDHYNALSGQTINLQVYPNKKSTFKVAM